MASGITVSSLDPKIVKNKTSSGKAGGLGDVNRSKRLWALGQEPPKVAAADAPFSFGSSAAPVSSSRLMTAELFGAQSGGSGISRSILREICLPTSDNFDSDIPLETVSLPCHLGGYTAEASHQSRNCQTL